MRTGGISTNVRDVKASIELATGATATGTGDSLGTVTISDGAGGAAIKTALKGLPPGPHGFHVHQNGSCQPTTANNQPVPAGAATCQKRPRSLRHWV